MANPVTRTTIVRFPAGDSAGWNRLWGLVNLPVSVSPVGAAVYSGYTASEPNRFRIGGFVTEWWREGWSLRLASTSSDTWLADETYEQSAATQASNNRELSWDASPVTARQAVRFVFLTDEDLARIDADTSAGHADSASAILNPPPFRATVGGPSMTATLHAPLAADMTVGGVSMAVHLPRPFKWEAEVGGVSMAVDPTDLGWVAVIGGPSMTAEVQFPLKWEAEVGGVSASGAIDRTMQLEAFLGGVSVEAAMRFPLALTARIEGIRASFELGQPPPVVPAADNVKAALQNNDAEIVVTWNPARPRRGQIIGYDVSVFDGTNEVVTFTGSPELRSVHSVSPGTVIVRVRGRTDTQIGPWSDPVPVRILRIRLDAQSDLVIGQWQLAESQADDEVNVAPTGLRRMIDIFLAVMKEHVITPMAAVQDQLSIDKAEGVWLDYLGARVGLERPESYNPALDDRFGFDDAGQPFDSHPFLGVDTAATVSFPIADDIYRRIIRARGISVLSDGNLEDFERAVLAIDNTASVGDRQNMTVRVVTDDDFILTLADAIGALPRPAGVQLVIAPRGQFGYDEAGVPFDQGPFA